MARLLTIKEASEFASRYVNRNVTASNIAYLISYGRISKRGDNGATFVDEQELTDYYKSYYGSREIDWKRQLGDDLNWALAFENLKEAETTKHVHRLHPYKGKFIPQLVEYFLDGRTDDFKTEAFFQRGDVVLDPFCGSGTTLVQAAEMGLHAVGIDVSAFNALISNVKIQSVDLYDLHTQIKTITEALRAFVVDSKYISFERELVEELNIYNNQFFPSPEFKIKARLKEIDERTYAAEKEQEFLPTFERLAEEFQIQITQPRDARFLTKWYLQSVRQEIDFAFEQIKKVQNKRTKKVLAVILSRTIRSCRATTHADLATLVEPITKPYYCAKHGKICKPLFSILSWWERYSKDSLQRLAHFARLKTEAQQICLNGNSESIDLQSELEKRSPRLAEIVAQRKIKGIFSSPPYVGLIDYHEQHAYAYDLFGFERHDGQEIGAMRKGQGKQAQQEYAQGVSRVLSNCRKYLADDFNIFLVANDKYNLYPQIAEAARLKIHKRFKRPVLNRTEKDKGAYSETIFHLKAKDSD
ncbi:MAG: site-specific DNA-methyltransferase [Pyrinomonadaceae bacterium MAG19_C2-C3]|nr:site-specific DNA-methyltransferase [Pyrinomonadaceae bacterium MAG19_C2-C3]